MAQGARLEGDAGEGRVLDVRELLGERRVLGQSEELADTLEDVGRVLVMG